MPKAAQLCQTGGLPAKPGPTQLTLTLDVPGLSFSLLDPTQVEGSSFGLSLASEEPPRGARLVCPQALPPSWWVLTGG